MVADEKQNSPLNRVHQGKPLQLGDAMTALTRVNHQLLASYGYGIAAEFLLGDRFE